MIRPKFRKEKNQQFWSKTDLSVDFRSTAGRPGFPKAVGFRSTAGRLVKVRELQVWPVECIGRLPVDRSKCVSSRFAKPVDWLVNRSTAYVRMCTLCTSVDCPPWASRPEFWNRLWSVLKIRFL